MDSHSSIEDPTSGHASQPNQTGTSSSMTRVLYNAAAVGKINAFKNIEKPLDHLFTVTKNTVLHIYITTIVTESESKTIFIKEILDECPSLLWQTNSKNETPLHLAARYGHIEIVSFLIERAKNLYQDPDRGEAAREMIWMTTQEKDTALHEALSHNHLEVATLLIKEDPNYSYFPNDAGETPLYIAVERNFRDLVSNVLDNCQSPAFGGPLGRTALHAAVLRDGTVTIDHQIRTIDRLLDGGSAIDHLYNDDQSVLKADRSSILSIDRGLGRLQVIDLV
ncbi:Death-associated protein kinase 1 [Morella rubra]|uniref:Death-associated protein kinase 1 n=1 Tax=Morella rubra TaxID=262757 RepID=A0A6A1UN14_9ROSI|nr:Death-associated protein kinase 1 [Morella rubra]